MTAESGIERARRELERVARLAEADADLACVQAYYAAFYAAQEAVFRATGKEPKTHRGTLREFGRLAHEAGDDEASRLFRQLEDARLDVHYGTARPSQEDARQKRWAAEQVVDAAQRIVALALGTDDPGDRITE